MDLNNLSEAAPPEVDPKAKVAKPAAEPKPYEPMVHGESSYDRVTSMLMSIVMGAGIIVGWLFLILYANAAYQPKAVAAVTIIEVYGGGSKDGNPDATGVEQTVANSTQISSQASNSEPKQASLFEEPAPQAMESRALDPTAAADSEGSEVASEDSTPGVGASTGPRSSSIGKGGNGIGEGGGPGSGVAREKRWIFEHPPGQTEDEYKAELDSLGIELATPTGTSTLTYASHFTTTPVQRTAMARLETRMYTSWSSPSRKQFDVALLRSAGVTVNAGSVIVQYLPKDVVEQISQTEFAFKNLQPKFIRRTRFKIVPKGGKYGFEVLSQELLVQP